MLSDSNIDNAAPTPNETRNRIIIREGLPLVLSYELYTWDILRWHIHQPLDNSGLDLGIPRQTDGITGLIDQHMGDLGFTLALIYLSRIPVEIGAKIYEAASNKRVSPRIKLCLSVLAGMAWPAMGEMGVNVHFPGVNEPADLFGVIVAGLVVTAGFETAEFLSTRPPHYLETKFTNLVNKIKPIAENVVKKFNDNFPLYINPATRLVEIKPRRPQDTKQN